MAEQIANIRTYEDGDFPALCHIEESGWESGGGSSRYFLREFGEFLRDTYLVAEVGDKVVGYTVAAVDQTDASRGWIINLVVHPEHRREGIGSVLIKHVLRRLQDKGCRTVFLIVNPKTIPAVQLYLQIGFQKVKEMIDYYGPGDDRYLMRLELG